MATAAEISVVRLGTNEPEDTNGFTDDVISTLIDEGDTDSATASIWRRKAAKYAELVDTTEAGASHKFSDLHKNALAMAAQYDTAEVESARAKVHKIVRS